MVRLALGLWLALAEPREEPAAAPIPIELRWSAPDECPDREAFLAAMTAIAGRQLVASPGAELVVDGRIEASSRGYALELQLRGPAGEEARTLEAPECGALASAGSLVVVTRLFGAVPPPPDDRPGSAEGGPGDEEAEVAAPPPVAETSPEPTAIDDSLEPPEPGPPAEVRPVARPVLQATLVALGGVAVGLGPRPTGIVRAGVGLRRGSVRVEAFAMHVFATTTGDGTEPGVRVSLSGGGALGCWAPTVLGRLEVPLCGGVALGAAVGRGIGPLVTTRDVQQLWVGLPLEAGVAWAPIPRLALRALVGGDIGLLRPGFHVDAGGERTVIERAWPVGLHAGGGLELRLP